MAIPACSFWILSFASSLTFRTISPAGPPSLISPTPVPLWLRSVYVYVVLVNEPVGLGRVDKIKYIRPIYKPVRLACGFGLRVPLGILLDREAREMVAIGLTDEGPTVVTAGPVGGALDVVVDGGSSYMSWHGEDTYINFSFVRGFGKFGGHRLDEFKSYRAGKEEERLTLPC